MSFADPGHECLRPPELNPVSPSYIMQANVPLFTPAEVAEENLVRIQCGASSRDADFVAPEGTTLGATDIYALRNRDDILVRSNPDDELTVQDAIKITNALDQARLNGVPVLPTEFFEDKNGVIFCAVPKVEGKGLDEEIENASPELIDSIDSICAAQASYIISQYFKARPIVVDMHSSHQYMVGTIPGQNTRNIWMVDISSLYVDAEDGTMPYRQDVAVELASIALDAVRIEEALPGDHKLDRARKSVLDSLKKVYINQRESFAWLAVRAAHEVLAGQTSAELGLLDLIEEYQREERELK